jgi:hypothetical protein
MEHSPKRVRNPENLVDTCILPIAGSKEAGRARFGQVTTSQYDTDSRTKISPFTILMSTRLVHMIQRKIRKRAHSHLTH